MKFQTNASQEVGLRDKGVDGWDFLEWALETGGNSDIDANCDCIGGGPGSGGGWTHPGVSAGVIRQSSLVGGF
jgi:hypothetical protein